MLFRSLQKELQRANRSFALLQRAPKSESLFCSFKKSKKERFFSVALLKRATKSDLLFCSLQKERQIAICFRSLPREQQRMYHSFALFLLFLSKKEGFALFQKERLPNPGYMHIQEGEYCIFHTISC